MPACYWCALRNIVFRRCLPAIGSSMKNTTRLQPELFLSSKRTFSGLPANRLLLLASLSIVLSACGGGSGSAENAAGSTQNTTDQQQVSIESPAEATSEPAPDVDELALGEALAAEFQTEFDSQQTTGFSACLLYTSPSPRDLSTSRMPSSA